MSEYVCDMGVLYCPGDFDDLPPRTPPSPSPSHAPSAVLDADQIRFMQRKLCAMESAAELLRRGSSVSVVSTDMLVLYMCFSAQHTAMCALIFRDGWSLHRYTGHASHDEKPIANRGGGLR